MERVTEEDIQRRAEEALANALPVPAAQPVAGTAPVEQRPGNIDLGIASPNNDSTLTLGLTIQGKTHLFTITRSAAASLVERITRSLV